MLKIKNHETPIYTSTDFINYWEETCLSVLPLTQLRGQKTL